MLSIFSMKKNLCHINHLFPEKYFTFEHFISIKFDFELKRTMSRLVNRTKIQSRRATQCAMQHKSYLSSVFYLEIALKNEKQFRNRYASKSQESKRWRSISGSIEERKKFECDHFVMMTIAMPIKQALYDVYFVALFLYLFWFSIFSSPSLFPL